MNRWASSIVLGLTGGMVKMFLSCCKRVIVHNKQVMEKIISERPSDQPLITISNHISTVDDPGIWASLSWRNLFNPDKNRWTLGAKEIMFTNPIYRWYFGNGQVIPTIRGNGVQQEAVDFAIKKLNEGKWVHMFPEGRIHNSETFELYPFRWGVGRLVDESKKTPWILPIYIRGFNDVMNHGKAFIPRPFGKTVEIFIGEPIKDIEVVLDSLRKESSTKQQIYSKVTSNLEQRMKEMGKQVIRRNDNQKKIS
eukprot:TRINITY_DN3639_c0_g1_i3.p2 TRINITY_DN3639_c0_g1~~TRINITY_DN3639_c0_g1_i3.p2  ORF type:complete len:252 (-),score=38.81 TRINITY_DN3639_c0_g1_i3:113-868(-)